MSYHGGGSHDTGLTLVKNNEDIVKANDHSSTYDRADNGGNAVFLRLQPRDMVFVRLAAYLYVWGTDYHTTFSGFLVTPLVDNERPRDFCLASSASLTTSEKTQEKDVIVESSYIVQLRDGLLKPVYLSFQLQLDMMFYRYRVRNSALTFPVQSLELLLELVHEAADGGADGSQVQLAELVLQTSGQFLSVTLGLALPRGDQLHQLRLALLHNALQLGIHLPALLQLPLRAGLQRTGHGDRAQVRCWHLL
ncbi:hypothetical protein FQN60_006326 [Etheostoma spectabile]|uniref:C1q domain-containing protein n=1 Tax=Etheostoma spectabile TaxID=54343 RepID=A0A5J5CPP2_9PERO|nr:hypothetical protein FQN60_006326 [Etheostoma spectabile]